MNRLFIMMPDFSYSDRGARRKKIAALRALAELTREKPVNRYVTAVGVSHRVGEYLADRNVRMGNVGEVLDSMPWYLVERVEVGDAYTGRFVGYRARLAARILHRLIPDPPNKIKIERMA